MPYRTVHGKHYHTKPGCHGAVIPCDTKGLSPCSDCCESGSRGIGTGAPVAGAAGTRPLGSDDDAKADGTLDARPVRPMQSRIMRVAKAIAGAGGMDASPKPMPEDIDSEEIAEHMASPATPQRRTPTECIEAIDEILGGTDSQTREALSTLANVSLMRHPDELPRDAALGQAMTAGCDLVRRLLDDVSSLDEGDGRRTELLASLGALTNNGLIKAMTLRSGRIPANWHVSHSFVTACNQHDMFYAMSPSSPHSLGKVMTTVDYKRDVLPAVDAIREWADSGFRIFPRSVHAVRRFPDGVGESRVWGGQESVLVLPTDVDDAEVRALMDRGPRRGKAGWDVFQRGVPGYWRLGMDPAAERTEHAESVAWMVEHSAEWDTERGRQALADYDENVMPILRWLSREDVQGRLRQAPDVEFIDLL